LKFILEGFKTVSKKIDVENLWLAKSMFLGGWMETKAVLRISYSNQIFFF
jgi:hypothetical protein